MDLVYLVLVQLVDVLGLVLEVVSSALFYLVEAHEDEVEV